MPLATTEALINELKQQKLTVLDYRGKMPTHETKTFSNRNGASLKGIAFHHSASTAGNPERFKKVAKYHVKPNHISDSGCPGICYTIGIAIDGEVCLFHSIDVATWSHGSANKTHLSCLVSGNFYSESNPKGHEPTAEQLRSVAAVAIACKKLWRDTFEITGHFQFGKPACPGATIEAMVRAIDSHRATTTEVRSLRDVQKALTDLGFSPGAVDGVDGRNTRNAVRAFQMSKGLGADGIAGPATKAALEGALKSA
jgi:hypothetical protein